jgi:hypothetical protein
MNMAIGASAGSRPHMMFELGKRMATSVDSRHVIEVTTRSVLRIE